MKTNLFLILIIFSLSSGCVTSRPHNDFSPDIYDICYKAKTESKSRILSNHPALNLSKDRPSIVNYPRMNSWASNFTGNGLRARLANATL